jgi:hypothetical protein
MSATTGKSGVVLSIATGAPVDGFSPEALKTRSLESLIDLYGPLDIQVSAFKSTSKKHEAIRAEIARRFEDMAADGTFTPEGEHFAALVGPKEKQRKITNSKLMFTAMKRAVGERLYALVKFNLSDIDANVPASECAKFMTQERTGRRPVESIAKQSVAQLAAA